MIRWYMADRGLGALEPKDEAVVRHVSACPACAARYDLVCADLDDAALAAVESADALFSADHLVQQRERVLRRLDATGAKVLAFPASEPAGRSAASANR